MIEQMSRVPETNVNDPFVDRIAEALRHRCGVLHHARLVVAVSGGSDSVALLRALTMISHRRSMTLTVGHVHHHLRGSEADEDAEFVERLADHLDLPYMRVDVEVDDGHSGNLEAKARKLRYEALATMAEVFDAPFVATAHHGDDQLETLLMRLLRGTSVQGLAGIAWRRELLLPTLRPPVSGGEPALGASALGETTAATVHVVRPMLAVDRKQVHAYLHELGQSWREDRTNQDVSRVRARLRREVLPVLEQIKPDAAHRAVVLADHVAEAAGLIKKEVDRWHEHVMRSADGADGNAVLDRGEARQLPRLVLIGLLRRALIEAGCHRDRLTNRTLMPMVRAIRDTDGGVRTFDLSKAVKVEVTGQWVAVRPAPGKE